MPPLAFPVECPEPRTLHLLGQKVSKVLVPLDHRVDLEQAIKRFSRVLPRQGSLSTMSAIISVGWVGGIPLAIGGGVAGHTLHSWNTSSSAPHLSETQQKKLNSYHSPKALHLSFVMLLALGDHSHIPRHHLKRSLQMLAREHHNLLKALKWVELQLEMPRSDLLGDCKVQRNYRRDVREDWVFLQHMRWRKRKATMLPKLQEINLWQMASSFLLRHLFNWSIKLLSRTTDILHYDSQQCRTVWLFEMCQHQCVLETMSIIFTLHVDTRSSSNTVWISIGHGPMPNHFLTWSGGNFSPGLYKMSAKYKRHVRWSLKNVLRRQTKHAGP